MAKDYAKAEKDLGVQHWVFISIERTDESGNNIRLFSYDLLRVEYVCDGETMVDYLIASWNFGWTGDFLDKIANSYEDYKITHWKYINKPKGVEE